MIKKTIKCKDFDGNSYKEELYFHLSKGELIDMAVEEDGDLLDRIMKIAREDDPIKIIPIMKNIILRAYGVKSSDGKIFIKDEETTKNFKYSQAFSELYTELSTDSQKAAEFINGIMPEFDKETQKKIEEARKELENEAKNKEGE